MHGLFDCFEPEVIFGLFDGEPGVFGFEQVADEVLDEVAVVVPLILVKCELALDDVIDGVAVIF